MYCKLTEKSDRTFGLPVAKTINRAKGVTGPDGVQHPASIFRLWRDDQLNAIGYARMSEDRKAPDGKMLDAFSDEMVDGVVVRTWTFKDKPVREPSPPDPENYKHDRKVEMTAQIGEGSYEEALGNQLDAFLKWATSVRMNQSEVETAIDGMTEISEASRTALKAALAPVFDLPADLDGVLGKWTAAKAKFPKPK